MDIAIFLKVLGNLLFAVILFLAVALTTLLTLMTLLLREFKPVLIEKMGALGSSFNFTRIVQFFRIRKSASDVTKIPADYWRQ
jgi:hypothetical protein